MFDDLFALIRNIYPNLSSIPLHIPSLGALEKEAMSQCIDSGFVSSVGAQVSEFENELCKVTGRRYAVATVNGTAALHLGLHASGVKAGDEIVMSPLTFIATANAVSYCGASPVFVDVERESLGVSPESLRAWLEIHTRSEAGGRVNRLSGRRVFGCLCMHTFGLPSRMTELKAVCLEFGLELFEDAAEALGSLAGGAHVGGDGRWAALSFNGNKVITTGGGGAVLTDDESLAHRMRHLATTAKQKHAWESCHDELGFNYRMPNLNAALGLAQLQRLPKILSAKRHLAMQYKAYAEAGPLQWVDEPENCKANFWLNTFICRDLEQRDQLIDQGHQQGIQLRPPWQLLSNSVPYQHHQRAPLVQAEHLAQSLVNVPSTPPAILA